jgi:hypothetical protein
LHRLSACVLVDGELYRGAGKRRTLLGLHDSLIPVALNASQCGERGINAPAVGFRTPLRNREMRPQARRGASLENRGVKLRECAWLHVISCGPSFCLIAFSRTFSV